MTFYDLIRAALLKDAEEHPYPGKNGESGQPSTEQHGDRESGEPVKEP
jgi:hypothetical protein